MAFARAADAPVHVVHLSSAAALDEVRRARAAGVRVSAETCPHYLVLTDERYDDPDPASCARYVISPPLRSAADRDALWAGLADGSLDLVATDHVPDRLDTEKAEAARGVPFDRISNGAPGIETLLAIVYSEGVARGRITVERMVDLLSTTPARRFGLASKGALEVGLDGDLVVFDPTARRTMRAADLHHTSDYTPYEGLEVSGAVRDVVRPRPWRHPRWRVRRARAGSADSWSDEPPKANARRAYGTQRLTTRPECPRRGRSRRRGSRGRRTHGDRESWSRADVGIRLPWCLLDRWSLLDRWAFRDRCRLHRERRPGRVDRWKPHEPVHHQAIPAERANLGWRHLDRDAVHDIVRVSAAVARRRIVEVAGHQPPGGRGPDGAGLAPTVRATVSGTLTISSCLMLSARSIQSWRRTGGRLMPGQVLVMA